MNKVLLKICRIARQRAQKHRKYVQNASIVVFNQAAIAQLGDRQTEDLKVPGSIPGLVFFLSRWPHS